MKWGHEQSHNFCQSPNEWVHIKHYTCSRWAARSPFWLGPCWYLLEAWVFWVVITRQYSHFNFLLTGFYELIKDKLTPPGGNVHHLPAWIIWIAAGTGGFLYWFLTYPTDVIKSSMQSDELDRSKRRFSGYINCARKLYTEDGGWRRFYRGFAPCLMRSIPANITMLYVVEVCRRFLDPYL